MQFFLVGLYGLFFAFGMSGYCPVVVRRFWSDCDSFPGMFARVALDVFAQTAYF